MVAWSYAYESCDPSAVIGFDGTVLARITWHAEGAEDARVVVDGDIDRDTAPLLSDQLLAALEHRRVVRCDLSKTGFLGAAGVGALVRAQVAAAGSGRKLLLTGVGQAVDYVLCRCGVLGVLAVER
ncbi:STAS domain-containing protein [Actinoplanes sp. CA-142083]|uniref:STAS domain-containing protein n=1 Tax=Actinoplanes sp. CA-142083 TaxID=3239903 RepID=UPI003D92CC1B